MGAGRALAELAEQQSSELVSLPSLSEPRSPALYSLDDDNTIDQERASLLPHVTGRLGGSEESIDVKAPCSAHRSDSDGDESRSGSEGQTRWRTAGRECIRCASTTSGMHRACSAWHGLDTVRRCTNSTECVLSTRVRPCGASVGTYRTDGCSWRWCSLCTGQLSLMTTCPAWLETLRRSAGCCS